MRAQNHTTDNLQARLANSEGEERIRVLLQLTKTLRSSQPEKALEYGYEVLGVGSDPNQIAEAHYQMGWAYISLREYDAVASPIFKIDSIGKSIGRPDLQAKSYQLRGRTARQRGDYDRGITALDSALILLNRYGETKTHLEVLNELGSLYRRKGQNEKAMTYHNEALEIARSLDDKLSISTTLGYIGIVHDIMGHYDDALKAHQETLKLRHELEDQRGIAAAVTNLGILHQKIRNFDQAMNLYDRALEMWKEMGQELELAATYNNMGAVEELQEKYASALSYYQNAFSIWERLGDMHSVSIALSNMGNVNRELGNYEQALTMIERSYEIRNNVGDNYGSASSLLDIAELHHRMERSNRALEAAHQGLTLAEQTQSWPMIQDANHMLSVLYKDLDQFDQALEYFEEYKAAHDSVFNIESQSVIAELQQTYRTQEQQQQIAMLQQREKINNIWLGVLGGGILAIAVVMVLIQSRYRMKKQAHEALEKLHAKEIEQAKLVMEKAEATARYLEAENERKSQELDAARELQLSMLPLDLPEIPNVDISAMMKTAAEVGGDYYDFSVTDDGKLTAVIGDATGHGVKAGTMVTATKSIFNLLADEPDLVRVLQLSTDAIRKMKFPKLYMVLALLRLNENRLHLAGAGMPPALIYRAGNSTVEQIELKGMPLGSSRNYPYQQQEIELEQGDVVLVYTDGLPELFSTDGKMLGYEAIPELLIEAGEGSAHEIIEHLRAAANRWIGDQVPEDDITVIAMKYQG